MYKEYAKVYKTIESCKTLSQLFAALRLVDNYGKVFGYNYLWSELDDKGSEILIDALDKLEYKERLESL